MVVIWTSTDSGATSSNLTVVIVAVTVALAGVIAFAGWRTIEGAATVGDLVGFVAAIGVMAPAVRAIGWQGPMIQHRRMRR